MSEQQNIQIVQQAYEAFKAGNMAAVLAVLSDDVEWSTPQIEGAPYPANCQGRQEVARFFAGLAEGEEIQQFEPQEFIAQGNKVVAVGNYVAKVKSTGREFGNQWVQIHTVQDGKVVKFQEIFDTASAARAYQKGLSA
jgi:ketosteroid isomerase-like protein